jgi:hypothetical protein
MSIIKFHDVNLHYMLLLIFQCVIIHFYVMVVSCIPFYIFRIVPCCCMCEVLFCLLLLYSYTLITLFSSYYKIVNAV